MLKRCGEYHNGISVTYNKLDIKAMIERVLLVSLILGINNYVFSQTQIIGKVIDAKNASPLAYVNIGINERSMGTVSKEDGSFAIVIPFGYQTDSLTFSMVGYYESSRSIRDLAEAGNVIVRLDVKTTQLEEVLIEGEELVAKRYGIKSRGAIHFTDGIFKKDDSFEIGQVIHLGNYPAKVTSVNFHINSSRPDSAIFRINFYRYDEEENTPKERIIDKSILQSHPVNEGWLKLNLSDSNIIITGSVLVSIEFIPETRKDVDQIFYEVKIGGSSKSFFRETSLGQWTRPPHHYCIYVIAITNKNAPDEDGDEETVPTHTLTSDFSSEAYSLFVNLPPDYSKDNEKIYPVIYLLDGNVYFDPVVHSVVSYTKKKMISADPIVVGIGYENAYVMDSLRNRDYTFPKALPSDSFKLSGQGDKFYDFIKKRIVSYIDSTYRTDKTNRTIMGHSLGGYFVLYALTRDLAGVSVFTNFIAASPSIYYHDNYLIKELGDSSKDMRNLEGINLYMTMGALEVLENQWSDFEQMSMILTNRKIRIHTEIYKNIGHMGTAIPTFENGIRLFMNN